MNRKCLMDSVSRVLKVNCQLLKYVSQIAVTYTIDLKITEDV